MNTPVRHRLVSSVKRKALESVVSQLEREGWRRLGDLALGMPEQPDKLTCWCQAMYLADEEIRLEKFDADILATCAAS